MSITIQEQIDIEKQKLASYQAESPVDTNKVNATINKISELEYQLQQQQAEQEEREQRKQETIETTTSVDVLARIFDTLMPAENYESILGPNRYDILSQDFKQVIQVYLMDTLSSVHAQHELEIARKDERIRLLNDQSLAVQNQLDEARRKIAMLESDVKFWNEKYDDVEKGQTEAIELLNKTKAKLNDSESNIEKIKQTNSELLNRNAVLENKLIAAQKLKQEVQPSQKLDDMLNAIKSKNELTADDLLARWNARQKSDEVKIALPEVPAPQGFPFRSEDSENSSANAGNVENMAAGNEAVTGEQFPTINPLGVPSIQTGPIHREVAPKTMEERIEALERAVFGNTQGVA